MGVFSKVGALFGSNDPEKKDGFDVNKPVSNPKLKKAITDFIRVRADVNVRLLKQELMAANFLQLVLKDGLDIKQTDEVGGSTLTVEKDGLIKFLSISDAEDNSFSLLFTDWEEANLWCKGEHDVVGWISPAREVFETALRNHDSTGVIINPGSKLIRLDRELLKELLKENPQ